MDHPASLGELETDIPIPSRSETTHVDVANGAIGSPARIVIKEIPLYRPRFLPSLLDSGEDSDNDDELVIEQAKVAINLDVPKDHNLTICLLGSKANFGRPLASY